MSTYELVLGDCHEWIKTIPDGSIDAVITDPPYHTTQLAFDKLEVRWAELWPEIYRVCKPSAVQVVFGAQPFTTDLIVSNRKRFRYPLVWAKSMPTGFLDANRRPLRSHEDILVFAGRMAEGIYNPQMTKGVAKGYINRRSSANHYSSATATQTVNNGDRYPTSVFNFGLDAQGIHPTQKPLELLCYLVKTYSNPGDTVLDFCAGSFTTGVACLLTGRSFLGCEIDPQYFAAGKKRMEATAAQGALQFARPQPKTERTS